MTSQHLMRSFQCFLGLLALVALLGPRSAQALCVGPKVDVCATVSVSETLAPFKAYPQSTPGCRVRGAVLSRWTGTKRVFEEKLTVIEFFLEDKACESARGKW